MSDVAAERARVLLNNARAAFEREAKVYDVLRDLADLVRQLSTELAEVRDDMVTLSNRIEAVTRALVREPGGEWRPR